MFPEKSDAASGPWRGLLLLCLLLITYGSLYPFHVVAPASLHDAWNAFITNFAVWTTRGDVIGNLALFVPLGLLDRKSTRLNSSHGGISRMPSSA